MSRVLAIDVGFTAMALVVLQGSNVLHAEVVRTEPTARKRGIRVADDDAERSQHLTRVLYDTIAEWQPVGCVVEFPSGGSQNARSGRTMGMASAIVSAVLEITRLPTEWVTPQMVKEAATGKKNASKVAVQKAVLKRFDWGDHWPKNKTDHEHVADAAGAVMAAEGGTLMRMIERMEVAG